MSAASAAPVACEKCLRPGDVQVGTPAGRIEQYGGVECYVTGSSKEAAIVYCTDIFGHKYINHQLLADKYAAAGFTVVIPNMFKSGPMSTDGYSVYALDKFFEWLALNPVDFATATATRVAEQLKSDYPSVQAVGFCYGARMVVDLVKRSPPLLNAAAVYHPTFLTADDAPAIKLPMLFNCAARELEQIFGPELRGKFEAELKDVPGSKFVDYPGTEHGFGARPEGELAHKSSAEAAVNTCAFFVQHK